MYHKSSLERRAPEEAPEETLDLGPFLANGWGSSSAFASRFRLGGTQSSIARVLSCRAQIRERCPSGPGEPPHNRLELLRDFILSHQNYLPNHNEGHVKPLLSVNGFEALEESILSRLIDIDLFQSDRIPLLENLDEPAHARTTRAVLGGEEDYPHRRGLPPVALCRAIRGAPGEKHDKKDENASRSKQKRESQVIHDLKNFILAGMG